MIRAASSDGITVAVHHLAGRAPQPVVLLAHATGFHGHAYLPIAKALAPRFHTYGMDFRGHGDTPRPDGWAVAWDGYGDDAFAAAAALAALPGGARGLIGFGHSMGGAALVMAAARRPELFRVLVLFEPIIFPIDRLRDPDHPNPLRDGARRRRATFGSFEEAIANYASKPPMAAFDPDALDAYVRHGFRQDGDVVRLKCDPDTEADTFDNGGRQSTWGHLAGLTVPIVVVAGAVPEGAVAPASVAPLVAEEAIAGRFVLAPALDHFGPLTRPADLAALITAAAAEI